VKVLVTGGNGEVGRTVVKHLSALHQVRVADINVPDAGMRSPDVEWMACDLTSERSAAEAMIGQDAVVHLAAIPNSFVAEGPEVLRVNVLSCYAIAEACRDAGVKKVIYAGSDSGLGFGIRRIDYKPAYLPIDGNHPCWPHESYSLSKYFGERLFEEYARAYRIPTLSIRLLYVLLDKRCKGEFQVALANRGNEAKADWLGGYVMPEDVAGMIAAGLDYDVAAARPDFPYEVFFAHAADTLNSLFTKRTTLELAVSLWGCVPELKQPEVYEKDPYAPFFDIATPARKLGYLPRHTYRDYHLYKA
jgi:UDP-glucose 4-epimerase